MNKLKSKFNLITLLGAAALLLLTFSCREAKETARVYVIVVDGMKPDTLARADTPVLDGLADGGVFSPRGKATIPTQTRVNFVTLPTGTHADRHLVVGSVYRDEDWQLQRTDGPTMAKAQAAVPVPTIFEVLEEKDITTGFFATKGYELVGGRGASVQVKTENLVPSDLWRSRYDDRIGGSRTRALENWLHMDNTLMEETLALTKEKDIRFFILNLGANDYVAHKLGPYSEESFAALSNADRLIGEFLEFLRQNEWYEQSSIIITSDHGFTQVGNPENVIMASGTPYSDMIRELEEENIVHNAYGRGGMSFSLYLKYPQKDYERTLEILKGLPYTDRIYSRRGGEEVYGTLADINYEAEGRSGEFFVDLNPEYTLNFDNRGQHGSSRDDDLIIPMIFFGHGIKDSPLEEAPANIDVAPTALALFGIDHRRSLQAQGRVLREIIVP